MRVAKPIAFVLVACVAVLAASAGRTAVPMSTEDRLQLPGWWPTKGSAPRSEFLGPDACAECHASKESQRQTPMAHASSSPFDSSALRAHEQLTFQLAPYTYHITRTSDDSLYSVSDGTQTISVPLGWAFGLGESGQTYVFERNGAYYESRVSFYRALDGLDLTPTTEHAASPTLENALGRRMSFTGEVKLCFGCHNTASTTNNRFDPAHMIPGVTCEACHGPGARHVAAMKAKQMQTGLKTILDPGQLDPIDLADFCGACHRTYVDVTLKQMFGIPNLRFQPYRLERSQCWIKSKAGLSCLTCHNPHTPRTRDPASFDDRCLSCHHTAATACPTSKHNCVSCHMPKYAMPGMHFQFTDHFIRIVRKGETYPD